MIHFYSLRNIVDLSMDLMIVVVVVAVVLVVHCSFLLVHLLHNRSCSRGGIVDVAATSGIERSGGTCAMWSFRTFVRLPSPGSPRAHEVAYRLQRTVGSVGSDCGGE